MRPGEGERVGLLGGTFDPPHYGHLALASEAAWRFDLDRVVLVPARRPPHKPPPQASFSHRMEMAGLAVAGDPLLFAQDLEGDTGASYSVDLLERLALPPRLTWFIIGMDSLMELRSWKSPERLLEIANVVAGTRPGYRSAEPSDPALERVETFSSPGLHISSSDLRSRFAGGRPTAYLIPKAVRSYILNRGLYGTGR
jgi:nicotinate-nucleotide adenylyltransferase